MVIGGGGVTPYYQNTMYFFDGTNFLNELKKNLGLKKLDPHRPPLLAFDLAAIVTQAIQQRVSGSITFRRHWFGSYYGTEQDEAFLLDGLQKQHFQPKLIRKRKEKPEKGVDMGVAVQMLTDAFNRTFTRGWLIAGDADYCELVREAKRYGIVISGCFFEGPTSEHLRRCFDEFIPLDEILEKYEPAKKRVDRLVEHIEKNGKDVANCPCCQPEPPPCSYCSGSGRSPASASPAGSS